MINNYVLKLQPENDRYNSRVEAKGKIIGYIMKLDLATWQWSVLGRRFKTRRDAIFYILLNA